MVFVVVAVIAVIVQYLAYKRHLLYQSDWKYAIYELEKLQLMLHLNTHSRTVMTCSYSRSCSVVVVP